MTPTRPGPDEVGPLLREVRAKEPQATVVPVRVCRAPWTGRRLEPAALALDLAAVRLWRTGPDGQPRVQVEWGPGARVRLLGESVLLAEVALSVLGGEGDRQGSRPDRHRVAGALERVLGPAPAVAPRATIDQVGEAPASRLACCALAMLCALVYLGLHLLLLNLAAVSDWTLDWRASVLVAVLLTAGALWLWLPRKRGGDGWVGLYPDRVVHLQDQLVVLPWSAVRGFDDQPSGWVALDCDPPLAIPTADEAARTAVLAALDAAGLARRS